MVIRHAIGQEPNHTLPRLNHTCGAEELFDALLAWRYGHTTPSFSSGFTLPDAPSAYGTKDAKGSTIKFEDALLGGTAHAANYNEISEFAVSATRTISISLDTYGVKLKWGSGAGGLPRIPVNPVSGESIRRSPPRCAPADVPLYTLDPSWDSSTRAAFERGSIDGVLEVLGDENSDDCLRTALGGTHTERPMQRLQARLETVPELRDKLVKQAMKEAK